jgi:hypothetical protein
MQGSSGKAARRNTPSEELTHGDSKRDFSPQIPTTSHFRLAKFLPMWS